MEDPVLLFGDNCYPHPQKCALNFIYREYIFYENIIHLIKYII